MSINGAQQAINLPEQFFAPLGGQGDFWGAPYEPSTAAEKNIFCIMPLLAAFEADTLSPKAACYSRIASDASLETSGKQSSDLF